MKNNIYPLFEIAVYRFDEQDDILDSRNGFILEKLALPFFRACTCADMGVSSDSEEIDWEITLYGRGQTPWEAVANLATRKLAQELKRENVGEHL